MKNNKKGNATVYLVILLIVAVAIAALFIKLNWRRFKAEASFGFTVAAVVIAVLLIIYFMIRRSIKKAKKKKMKEMARLEKEKKEQERIAAGGKPRTIGDGKFEMNDISDAADIAKEKISGLLNGDE